VTTWRQISRTTTAGTRIAADVRVDGPGWDEFWQLYADGGWEPWTTELMDALLVPGSVFVDVGAWIGPLTIYAALACQARVIAVEPDPVAFDALNDTIYRNALQDIETTSLAVTKSSGNHRLIQASDGAWGDSMTRLGRGRHGSTVRGATLPQILADMGVSPSEIGLVKIDVEGYEEQLMPRLGPWLGSLGIPLQVACHDVAPKKKWFRGYLDVRRAAGEATGRGYTGEVVALPWQSHISHVRR